MIIDLLRHGEPEGGKRFRGHGVDDPLSDKGWQQMWQAVADHKPWQHIISSPMLRCHAFAEALSDRHGIPVSVEHDLREVGFGSWEGKTREHVMQHRLQEYNAFYQDPINSRPWGAEPFHGFVSRVGNVYDRLLQAHAQEHVLVVAHAGVIRAVLIHALNEDPVRMYKTTIDNASITRISHDESGARTEFINGTL